LRLGGNTFLTLWAALFTGGIFIFSTFHWWWLALASAVLAVVSILVWLWTGTAEIPEKPEKDVSLGLTLPIYVSGPSSVGWWGMFITMMGILTAFISLVFGYFFYWTARPDFPPDPTGGPGVRWPALALVLVAGAWVCTLLARRWNRMDARLWLYAALAAAVLLAGSGAAALIAGPWLTGLDPERHVYGAIVWILIIWCAAHAGVGIIMHGYCAARRLAGRMTAQHDQDIVNVALYWHFVAFKVFITVAVIGGFPLMT
jgi:cytochrome c oxidase subunit I+III